MLLNQQKNLQLIQLLRGIASMLVVLLHLTVNYPDSADNKLLGGLFLFGGSGVDIFFVLSGFIITYSSRQYLGQASAVTKFLKRRFIRVFPIYWLAITLFLALQLALPQFYKTHFYFSTINILRTYFLLPNHFMVNGVSWSLTNELFFYLLFTVALFIPNKKITRFLFFSCFLFLIVAAVINIDHAADNIWISMLANPMNIEFLLGILIVLLMDKISVKMVYPLLITGVFLFVVSAFLIYRGVSVFNTSYNPALSRVVLFGVPSFLIILSLVKLERHKKIQVKNIFLCLGDASYSIYLIHLPIVAAFYKILSKLNINNALVLSVLSIFIFFAVCKLGIIIYNKAEKPLIKKLNQMLL
jgi:exopolysaccharide production protein ExoZ